MGDWFRAFLGTATISRQRRLRDFPQGRICFLAPCGAVDAHFRGSKVVSGLGSPTSVVDGNLTGHRSIWAANSGSNSAKFGRQLFRSMLGQILRNLGELGQFWLDIGEFGANSPNSGVNSTNVALILHASSCCSASGCGPAGSPRLASARWQAG